MCFCKECYSTIFYSNIHNYIINFNFTLLSLHPTTHSPTYFPLGCLAELLIEFNVTLTPPPILLPAVGDGLLLVSEKRGVGGEEDWFVDVVLVVEVVMTFVALPFELKTGILEGLNFSVGIELFRTGTGISELVFLSKFDLIWSTCAEWRRSLPLIFGLFDDSYVLVENLISVFRGIATAAATTSDKVSSIPSVLFCRTGAAADISFSCSKNFIVLFKANLAATFSAKPPSLLLFDTSISVTKVFNASITS